jgi:soluble P-type ATPase
MLEIDIPGFGMVKLRHLVSDFTGTLSVDGELLPGIKKRLQRIAKFLQIHILTSDTFGTAKAQLKGVKCSIHILDGKDHDLQKERYVLSLGAQSVVAIGNGNNDRKMLKASGLGIAVTEGEGCAIDALMAANIHVRSAKEGLDLLLNPKRCKATLRY